MQLQVQNITKFYNQTQVLHNIHFTINTGEIVGFLGQNGAGKTTTLKILAGILKPTSGQVILQNNDIVKSPLLCKKNIGYLSEINPLYEDMFVCEYLDFIGKIHQIENCKKRVNDIIVTINLHKEKHKKIKHLSKGNRQRVGLAAAFLHNPFLLLLDEPTSGLDPQQSIEVRKLIQENAAQKIIFFSSHSLAEIEAVCNRIIIIHEGKIVADDALNNLLKKVQTTCIVEFENEIDKAVFLANDITSDFTFFSNKIIHFYAKFDIQQVKNTVMQLSLQHNFNIRSIEIPQLNLEKYFIEINQKNIH